MAPKVLFVLTSCGQMDNGHPTGWFLPEFAHPYYALIGTDDDNPKAEVTVASPNGNEAPLDPASVKMFSNDQQSVQFLNSKQKLWKETRPLKDLIGKASEFDAIFYVGGHGPMFDLVEDPNSIKLIQEFYSAGKPVSAVCHGPIVFVNVEVDGKPLLQGREVTGFSNAEEDLMKLSEAMPQLLETEVERVGGKFVKAPKPWGPKVVVDGQVITGQNPASAEGIGKTLAKILGIN